MKFISSEAVAKVQELNTEAPRYGDKALTDRLV